MTADVRNLSKSTGMLFGRTYMLGFGLVSAAFESGDAVEVVDAVEVHDVVDPAEVVEVVEVVEAGVANGLFEEGDGLVEEGDGLVEEGDGLVEFAAALVEARSTINNSVPSRIAISHSVAA